MEEVEGERPIAKSFISEKRSIRMLESYPWLKCSVCTKCSVCPPVPTAGILFSASLMIRIGHRMRVSDMLHLQARPVKTSCAILHCLSSPLCWWHAEHPGVDSEALGDGGATMWKEPGFLNGSRVQSTPTHPTAHLQEQEIIFLFQATKICCRCNS